MTDDDASFPVRVLRKWHEAEGVVGLELVAFDGGKLPAFMAGGSLELTLPGGIARSYSIANAPTERHRYLLAVLREPASLGGSAAVHERLREGDVLPARGPWDDFPLAAGAVHSLLLAGGIGITPLVAMAHQLYRQGAPFTLHYAARGVHAAAFAAQLRAAPYAHRVCWHFSHRGVGERLDFTAALARVPWLSHVYACGPTAFVAQAVEAARRCGWPEERLHIEAFGTR
ncbi:ferredoxin reductase [Variovorax boronicumulans]|uniref:ferredoxin reductase n=1 Tax=Variovorax boronicumulans TaxID=436515 RepID=UPI001C56F9DA